MKRPSPKHFIHFKIMINKEATHYLTMMNNIYNTEIWFSSKYYTAFISIKSDK